MSTFPYPATVEFENERVSWIGKASLFGDPEADGQLEPLWVLEVSSAGDTRSFPITSITEVSPQEWEGESWVSGRSGIRFRVRPTLPRDAESSLLLSQTDSRYPMPVELLASLHSPSDGVLTMPQLYALSDDDGFVGSLLLSASTGLYVRYGFAWHYVSDPELIDGMNVVEVGGASVDLFDDYAKRGQSPIVSTFPAPKEDELDTWASLGEPVGVDFDGNLLVSEDSGASVVASAGRTDVPALITAEDAPKAIQAALESPELRWYVERRIGALGLEVELPWD